jgi:hypothetical protein
MAHGCLRLIAMRILQAGMGAGSAATAILSNAQLLAQVTQTTRAVSDRLVNLALGDTLADTDIHDQVPVESRL